MIQPSKNGALLNSQHVNRSIRSVSNRRSSISSSLTNFDNIDLSLDADTSRNSLIDDIHLVRNKYLLFKGSSTNRRTLMI